MSVNGGVRRFVHDGIDIVAPRGHPILAPMDGVVSAVLKTPKNGLIVYIDHGTVDGLQPFTTYYFHLDSASVVDRQTVVRGQMIGRVGNSGYTATEVTHLHFGVLSGHRNPHEFWIGGEGIIVCFEEGREYHPKGASVLTYPVECIDEP